MSQQMQVVQLVLAAMERRRAQRMLQQMPAL
jgi:hypothetical protein